MIWYQVTYIRNMTPWLDACKLTHGVILEMARGESCGIIMKLKPYNTWISNFYVLQGYILFRGVLYKYMTHGYYVCRSNEYLISYQCSLCAIYATMHVLVIMRAAWHREHDIEGDARTNQRAWHFLNMRHLKLILLLFLLPRMPRLIWLYFGFNLFGNILNIAKTSTEAIVVGKKILHTNLIRNDSPVYSKHLQLCYLWIYHGRI